MFTRTHGRVKSTTTRSRTKRPGQATIGSQAENEEGDGKAMGRLRRILHLSQAESALFVLEQAAQYIEYAEQKENKMPGFRPMADLLPKPVAPKGKISNSVLTLLKLCCDENFGNNWNTTIHSDFCVAMTVVEFAGTYS